MKILIVCIFFILNSTLVYAAELVQNVSSKILCPQIKIADGTTLTSGTVNLNIQRASDSYYWTGSVWQVGSSNLAMTHQHDGIWTYTGTIDTAGDMWLTCQDSGGLAYRISWSQTVYAANRFNDNTDTVDIGKWSGTAVATPDTAGYPKVTIKDGTGVGEIDTLSGSIVNVDLADTCTTVGTVTNGVTLSAAATSAQLVDDMWDEPYSSHTTAGTYSLVYKPIQSSAAQAVAAGTITLSTGASASNDYYNNLLVVITNATAGAGQVRKITAYDGTTKIATLDANWIITPTGTVQYMVTPDYSTASGSLTAADVWTYGSGRTVSAATNITDTGLAIDLDVNNRAVIDLDNALNTLSDTQIDDITVGSVTGAVGSVTGLTASNLDVAVSTRLATSGYTTPDNTGISAIKTKTDFLPSATAGAAGGVLIAGTNASATFTGNVAMQGGLTITQSTVNASGISITGNGTGNGVTITGGSSGASGIRAIGADGILAVANGDSSNAGIRAWHSGNDGDGIKAVAGAISGADIRGNITGNLSGSVNSVASMVTANVTQISGDSTAADNLEANYDGTGYAGEGIAIIIDSTNTSASTAMVVDAASAGVITADNQHTGKELWCHNEVRLIDSTDQDTTDDITTERANPFNAVPGNGSDETCYIK